MRDPGNEVAPSEAGACYQAFSTLAHPASVCSLSSLGPALGQRLGSGIQDHSLVRCFNKIQDLNQKEPEIGFCVSLIQKRNLLSLVIYLCTISHT